MTHFCKALTSEAKNEALPEEFNYFGKLIGSWKIDYVDNSTFRFSYNLFTFALLLIEI